MRTRTTMTDVMSVVYLMAYAFGRMVAEYMIN